MRYYIKCDKICTYIHTLNTLGADYSKSNKESQEEGNEIRFKENIFKSVYNFLHFITTINMNRFILLNILNFERY